MGLRKENIKETGFVAEFLAFIEDKVPSGRLSEDLPPMMARLKSCAKRGLTGHSESYADYQSIMLEMHLPGNPGTESARRWIASEMYQVEEEYIPKSDTLAGDFKSSVERLVDDRTRIKHPMSDYIFNGKPSRDEVRFFIAHHWVRSYDFYRLLAELAFRFVDVQDAAVFYRNLYGEAGGKDSTGAHPKLLEKLMVHFNIPLQIDFSTSSAAEKAYLNNRLRCVRHPDIAWGLALIYAVESVSVTNHRKIYELLKRTGVPEDACDFHRLHSTADEIDTAELWELIEKHNDQPSFQSTFLRSLNRHFEINKRYFDVLWDQLQRGDLK